MQRHDSTKGESPALAGDEDSVKTTQTNKVKELSMSNSTEIQVSSQPVFNFGEHSVRVVVREGEPWFVATDICSALDYKNASKAVADHLDDDERSNEQLDRSRMGSKAVIISESGLYALVLRSRKPEARKFAKWVTSEVLPAIRKTGVYVGKAFSVNPDDELTQDEQDTLRTLLQSSAENLPKAQRGKFMMQGWAKLKSHFKVSYREIPRTEFSAAVSIVTRHTLEWELVDDEPIPKKYHFPLEAADPHDRWLQNAWITPRVLMDPQNRALELELIAQLEKDGHDVAGVRARIIAMRENMAQVEQAKEDLRRVRDRLGPILEIINVGLAERGLNVQFASKPTANNPIDRHVSCDQLGLTSQRG